MCNRKFIKYEYECEFIRQSSNVLVIVKKSSYGKHIFKSFSFQIRLDNGQVIFCTDNGKQMVKIRTVFKFQIPQSLSVSALGSWKWFGYYGFICGIKKNTFQST